MTTSIFCKSHGRDFPWLEYAKRSIRKFASGFDEIVLALPEGETFDWPEARIVHIREHGDKYLEQQSLKLYADTFCSSDYIVYHDSDCVFTRPVTPETFFRDGKPIWIHKEFRDDEQRAWAPVISKWMNEPASRSFMTRHDFCLPRGLLTHLRQYCVDIHRQELCDYIQAQHVDGKMLQFSEFNCAGAYAHKFTPNLFTWIDGDKETEPPSFIFQGFTHGGEQRKAQDLAEFERLLREPNPKWVKSDAPIIESDLGVTLHESVAVVQNVKYHIAALAEMAKANGLAKGRIALALKRAGLVKK